MAKYESHLTVSLELKEEPFFQKLFETILEANGFKHSEILGDPVLGPKAYQYASGYAETYYRCLKNVTHLKEMLQQEGIVVLRTKVEKICFDWRRKDA